MSLPYPIQNRYGETVSPTGHIRERIAASISAGKPSHYSVERHCDVRLSDPTNYFLSTFNAKGRAVHEEWADFLLVALDKVGLKIVEADE